MRVRATQVRAGLGAAGRMVTRRRAAPGALVLAYHDVSSNPTDEPWSVTVDGLAAHVRTLRRLGTTIVDLALIVERQRRGQTIEGLAAITFDDALKGVYRHGLPLLAKLDVPSTVFVVTGTLGSEPPWWPGASPTMTAEELREIGAAGVRLAAHSRTHRSLPSLSRDELVNELAGCRDDLAALVPEPTRLIAYPSGHHNRAVRRVAAGCGFVAGFTFLNGRVTERDDPYRLPRLTMGSHVRPWRLVYHVARSPDTWPDHQLEAVVA
ncbi:MAG: polysaccharide deacetylase family protein [Actinomycetia bacterium]|nr:polysaccharide deacetylase family protein [Actinomycetes bacterium]